MVKRTAVMDLITRKTGRSLNWSLWSDEEIEELQRLSEDLKTTPMSCIHIPVIVKSQADPRLQHDCVLRRMWETEENCRELGLTRRKGNLVIRLERTLVSVANEKETVGFEELTGNEEIQSISEQLIAVETAKGRLVVTAREGAQSFLASLQPFYRFFLLSSLPHAHLHAILKALDWLHFFEDIIEDREIHKLEDHFPRLADTQERAITLIFDCKLLHWHLEDLCLIVPSLRYVALEPLEQQEAFALPSDSNIQQVSWFTVTSDCTQLSSLSNRLQRSMLRVFKSHYSHTLRQAYIAEGGFPRKMRVLIDNLERKRLARTLGIAIGMKEVKLNAKVVLVEDFNVQISLEAQVWPLSGLVRAYFNIKQ